MVKCAQCKRKFRFVGKTINPESPDYIRVIHPRRNTKGIVFCSERCMYIFYARGLIAAMVAQTEEIVL